MPNNDNKGAKIIILLVIRAMSIACKTIIPVHIAFIPVLIPPMLGIFDVMYIARRLIVCVIIFGVIVTYMIISMGFREIFLENIMLYYLRTNDLIITLSDLISALAFPVIRMTIGLLMAFIRYGKPRYYKDTGIKNEKKR
jgi:predicted histidine transporter YuiF (NhaC family)